MKKSSKTPYQRKTKAKRKTKVVTTTAMIMPNLKELSNEEKLCELGFFQKIGEGEYDLSEGFAKHVQLLDDEMEKNGKVS